MYEPIGACVAHAEDSGKSQRLNLHLFHLNTIYRDKMAYSSFLPGLHMSATQVIRCIYPAKYPGNGELRTSDWRGRRAPSRFDFAQPIITISTRCHSDKQYRYSIRHNLLTDSK